MSSLARFAAAPALVLLMSGTAHAALTADQIWQQIRSQAEGLGLRVEIGSEERSGNVLTLKGLNIVLDPPVVEEEAVEEPAQDGGATAGDAQPGDDTAQDEAVEGEEDEFTFDDSEWDFPESQYSSTTTIGDLILTEEGDGSVTITLGGAVQVVAGDPAFDEKSTLDINHEGLVVTAREGDAGAISYDYKADAIAVIYASSMAGFSEGAEPMTSDFSLTGRAVTGNHTISGDTLITHDFKLEMSDLATTAASAMPEWELGSSSEGKLETLALSGKFALPADFGPGKTETGVQFAEALTNGFAVRLDAAFGKMTGSGSAKDMMLPPYTNTYTSEPGTFSLSFDKDAAELGYAFGAGDATFTVQEMPTPIQVTAKSADFGLRFPVMAPETAADWFLRFNLADLVVNKEAYDLFDPEAKISRDGANIAIDLSGKAKNDFAAQMAANDVYGEPPMPQPESLDIKAFSISVAGAALETLGAFTFDNSMGFPSPIGTADVTLTGADQLLDGLVAVGVITEEDAFGYRMGMSGFFVAGADENTKVSKIEAKEGGSIFVNGQQVQ